MSNEEFVNKVAEMREAQRAYFKSRRDWHLQEAKRLEKEVCAIGDEDVMIITGEKAEPTQFSEIVETARHYIKRRGGFEKFAEWGLII